MSNNFIRVLRNTALCDNHEAAIEKLQRKLANLQDGEICIASYGATWDVAKTILGVVRVKTVGNVTKRSYTIFDNEANSAEILAKIQELDADKTVPSADGHVTVRVVEADGLLTTLEVSTNDIASAALLGTKDDEAGTETAFARIAKEATDRDTAITAAVNALDSSVAATVKDGEQYSVLTGVTQTDGKLTKVAEVKLAAVAKTGLASDVATTAIGGDTEHVAVAGTNVSAQITDIAKTLKGISDTQANPVKYITHKLSDTEVTALGDSNVKDAYEVFAYTGTWNATANKGTKVGDTIKIYKDATIHKIYLGYSDDTVNPSDGSTTTGTVDETKLSLNYVYITATGTYAMASVPVGSFLRQSEFKNGLHVANNGEVSVKVDTTSEDAENFLSVGENGIKLSGVQTAIDAAIAKLDTTVESTGDKNVSVTVAQTDGLVSGVTVSTSGLALASEVIKGVTVNDAPVTVKNNTANITIDGTDVAVANSTEPYETTVYSAPFEGKVGTNHIATGDTVAAAFKKTENTISVLADEVIANEKVTTTAVSKLAESVGGVTNTDGVIKYTPNTNANYIGEATSVHDATVKLDAAIKTVADTALTSVAGGEAITVSGGKTVSLKLDAVKTDNALTITTNGLYLSNVWDCGEY